VAVAVVDGEEPAAAELVVLVQPILESTAQQAVLAIPGLIMD
jgi:hypothetical protein